jgi:hypothetical protein
MKKLYTLSLILISAIGFSQPVLTAFVDGPCPGGLPKVCEIYAKGTVDFTQFSAQNQTNANVTWGAAVDLSSLGTRTNEFVYIILTNGNLAVATTEFPMIVAGNSFESGVMNLNGDDRLRIINTSSEAVIDQFGVSDIDGTGTTWEWLDTYAKRNNSTGPDGGFVEANWTFAPINTLDTAGTCLTVPGPQVQTIVNLGSFTLSLNKNAIAGLKVYPNPVGNGIVYISTDINAEKSIQIYDILGKQVLNKVTTAESINVANLKSGVYIMKITEEGNTSSRKLVIK